MSMDLMVKAFKVPVGNPLRKLILVKLADMVGRLLLNQLSYQPYPVELARIYQHATDNSCRHPLAPLINLIVITTSSITEQAASNRLATL